MGFKFRPGFQSDQKGEFWALEAEGVGLWGPKINGWILRSRTMMMAFYFPGREISLPSIVQSKKFQNIFRFSSYFFGIWITLCLSSSFPQRRSLNSQQIWWTERVLLTPCWVQLEVDQPSGSTYISIYVCCVHYNPLCQSRPVTRRQINSLTVLHLLPFYLPRQGWIRNCQIIESKLVDREFSEFFVKSGNLFEWAVSVQKMIL